MSRGRVSVKRVRDVLRYKHELGLSNERIAKALGVAKGTVHNVLERFSAAGLGWPLSAQLSDSELEATLYERGGEPTQELRLPDMDYIEKELRRPHVTLQLSPHRSCDGQPTALSGVRLDINGFGEVFCDCI